MCAYGRLNLQRGLQAATRPANNPTNQPAGQLTHQVSTISTHAATKHTYSVLPDRSACGKSELRVIHHFYQASTCHLSRPSRSMVECKCNGQAKVRFSLSRLISLDMQFRIQSLWLIFLGKQRRFSYQ